MKLAPAIPKLGMSREEAAMAIGVSPNTLDDYVREGLLPPPRRIKKRKFWLVREIEAAMLDWPIEGGQSQEEQAAKGWVAK